MIRGSIPADPIVPAPHEVRVALRRLAAINDASEAALIRGESATAAMHATLRAMAQGEPASQASASRPGSRSAALVPAPLLVLS
jgi:hypothetical protein